MTRNNILVEYPNNKSVKFLFTKYPIEELTGRERVIKDELILPGEDEDDLFVAVETDLLDLPLSLQVILKREIAATETDTLVFRTFFEQDGHNLYAMSDADVYNLVYDEIEWAPEIDKTNKELN